MRAAKTALAAAERFCAKAQNSRPLRTSRAVYSTRGKRKLCAWGQNCGISHRSLASAEICWNSRQVAFTAARSCLRWVFLSAFANQSVLAPDSLGGHVRNGEIGLSFQAGASKVGGFWRRAKTCCLISGEVLCGQC